MEAHLQPEAPVSPVTWGDRLARWVSNVGSPAIFVAGGSLAAAFSLDLERTWNWLLFQIITTDITPVAYILFLVRRRWVSDFEVYQREQRWRPYLFTLLCIGLSLLVMRYGRAPRLFLVIAAAGMLQTALMFLINLHYKISAHAAAAAGFAVVIWQVSGSPSLLAFASIPLVIWSRVHLRRHTLGQTLSGSLLGLVTFLASFVLFPW